MNKFHLLNLLVVILLVLSACNRTYPKEIFSSGDTCSPPCWKNIIPGKASIEEVKEKFLKNDNINYGNLLESNTWKGYEYLWFELKGYTNVIGHVYYLNGTVAWIDFSYLPKPIFDSNGLFNITMKDIQENIGEPDYIYVIRNSNNSNTIIVDNQEKGIYYQCISGLDHNTYQNLLDNIKNEINPETYISYLMYYDPSIRLTFSDKDKNEKYRYIWNGFGNLDELYPSK